MFLGSWPNSVDEPTWMEKPEVLIAHSRQLVEHGGPDGLRDEKFLDSALGKPKNVFVYEDEPTLARLAASYAFGLARNHPFIDGNKRTAMVVAEGFLRVNGVRIDAPAAEKYLTYVALAADDVSEQQLTDWYGSYTVHVDS